MPRRVAMSTLNASTVDIINTIRQNAPAEYRDSVPELKGEENLREVGAVIYGDPAFSNYFINALVNRIAAVRVKSATFNNAYAELKKGFLEYGETVEEVFVNLAKAREFSVEKAEAREFKRTLPDVRSAFHVMNYRVQYPVTIQDQDLKQAFLSMEGVQDLIARIVNAVYTGAEYDEFLLFKYLMIKAITKGQMYPVSIGDGTNMNDAAEAFRGTSNQLEFIQTRYNASGVHTSTPRDDQYIFMDANYNAKYDVNVLAGAFNMDKATFIGHLKLVDDWTTFDNERFQEITQNTNQLEPVTDAELELMKNVKAVLADREWFQIYDNKAQFSEKYVASGLYWNYFYNIWKTVSSSPFSNAVVFVTDTASTQLPENITVEIMDKSDSDSAITLTLIPQNDTPALAHSTLKFHQTEALITAGIGVHPYGALLIPASQFETPITLEGDIDGVVYKAAATITSAAKVNDTVQLDKQTEAVGP